MRFRTQVAQVGLFQKIIRSLSATAKNCIIKFSPESVHFIVTGAEGGPSGVQIWSQVKVNTLFDNYRIESRSNNEIYLEIQLDALSKALRSAESAGHAGGTSMLNDTEVVCKLGKKHDRAVLIFEIMGSSHSGFPLEITHDVQCNVLGAAHVQELREPLCPTPDIHIQLPALDKLKGIANRLGRMGSHVKISANLNGVMTFEVNSPELTVETSWSKLVIPKFVQNESAGDNATRPPPDQMFSVTIGIRALQKLFSTNLTNSTTIACICNNYCLIAYVYIGDIHDSVGVLTLFIPAVEQ